MKKSVALISCSNGLGHIRRLLTIAKEFSLFGYYCDLYAPILQYKKILQNFKINNLNIKDFDTNTRVSNWQNEYNFNWLKKIKNLDKYDFVVSDNLIEILKLRPDSWITGSFFWHHAINNLPKKLIRECNDIIERYPPNLICSSLFVPPYFHKYKNLHLVGLYTFDKGFKAKRGKNKDLLISCGHGGLLKDKFLKFIKNINLSHYFDTIWIEPSLYNCEMPKFIKPATYNKEMYREISAAIIRPGIGTVTDCLNNCTRIFSVIEDTNQEIKFNAKVLFENNLGYEFNSIGKAFEKVCEYILDKKDQDLFEKNIKRLDFDGAKQTVKIILDKKIL